MLVEIMFNEYMNDQQRQFGRSTIAEVRDKQDAIQKAEAWFKHETQYRKPGTADFISLSVRHWEPTIILPTGQRRGWQRRADTLYERRAQNWVELLSRPHLPLVDIYQRSSKSEEYAPSKG